MAHQSQLTRPLYSLTIGGCQMLVKCWRITRKDGTIFRFTDHSSTVDLDGQTYSPAGGFLSSADEGTDGLKPGNRELQGILTSALITEDDLRAGRYRGTQIEEFIVDPRWTWVGIFRQNLYWIQEVRFNGEMWETQLEGPLNRLRVTRGFTYETKCRWLEFGDSNCQFNLSSVQVSGSSVSTIVTARKTITTNVPTGNGDNYYNDGKITWTTGNNAGLITDIKDYTELSGVITFFTEPPFDVQVGDTFDIVPGCDRQFSTCQGYNNKDNFGGFQLMPGNDDTFTTPEAPAG